MLSCKSSTFHNYSKYKQVTQRYKPTLPAATPVQSHGHNPGHLPSVWDIWPGLRAQGGVDWVGLWLVQEVGWGSISVQFWQVGWGGLCQSAFLWSFFNFYSPMFHARSTPLHSPSTMLLRIHIKIKTKTISSTAKEIQAIQLIKSTSPRHCQGHSHPKLLVALGVGSKSSADNIQPTAHKPTGYGQYSGVVPWPQNNDGWC